MPVNTLEVSIPPLLHLLREYLANAEDFGPATLKAIDALVLKANELRNDLPLNHPLHTQVSIYQEWVHELKGIGSEAAWAREKISLIVAELNLWEENWAYESLDIGKTIHRIISVRKELELLNISGLKSYVRAAQAVSNLTPPALLLTSLLLYILPPLTQLNRLLIIWTSRCEVCKLYPMFMEKLEFCESEPTDIKAFFNAARMAGDYLDDMLNLTMDELPSQWLDRMDGVDEKVKAALKTLENDEMEVDPLEHTFNMSFEGDSMQVEQEPCNILDNPAHTNFTSIPQTPILGGSSTFITPPMSSPTHRHTGPHSIESEGLDGDDVTIPIESKNSLLPSRNLSKQYSGLVSFSGEQRKSRRDITASTIQSIEDSIFDENRSVDSASEPEAESTKADALPDARTSLDRDDTALKGTRRRGMTSPISSSTSKRVSMNLANKKSSPALFTPPKSRSRTPIQKNAAFKALQKTSLDRKISKIVEDLPVAMKLTREDKTPSGDTEDGIYQLHHKVLGPTSLYCRILSDRVMVRVGGGWSDLESYLLDFANHHSRANVEFSHSETTYPTSRTQTSRPASRLTRPESRFSGRCATPDTCDGRPDTPMTPRAPLGLAGPQSKLFGQTSPEKLAWVEDVATKLRQNKKLMPSTGPARVYTKTPQQAPTVGRNTPSRCA